MRIKRKRVDVNLEELDRVLDHAREAPLSEPDYDKLKEALHALAGMLPAPRSTEKTSAVLPPTDPPNATEQRKAQRPRAQRSFLLHRRKESRGSASHDCTPAIMPRLRKRQSLSTERTPDAGENRRAGAAGRHRVRTGSAALQSVRRSVHRARAGRRRT